MQVSLTNLERHGRRPRLQPLFDELNQRYWQGRLPRYRVSWSPWWSLSMMAECDDAQRRIVINRSLGPASYSAMLLKVTCYSGKRNGLRMIHQRASLRHASSRARGGHRS